MMSNSLRPDRESETLGTAEIERAHDMQRMGLTLTEIAAQLGVDRSIVVDELYVAQVADLSVPPARAKSKARFAGSSDKLRLKGVDGRWLHSSTERFTLVRADAWMGTPEELFALQKRQPNLSGLTVVAA